jgi:hypothetical protein
MFLHKYMLVRYTVRSVSACVEIFIFAVDALHKVLDIVAALFSV